MMNKKTLWLGAALIGVMGITGCGGAPGASSKAASSAGSDKIPVVVSFNAMKEFTEAVGKDKVTVTTMIPDGTEPHDFEPTAADLKKLSDAKVFVYSGMGMENWADKAVQAADQKKLLAVEASRGVEPVKLEDPDEIKEHGPNDPHVWLSISGAEQEAANIRDALIKASPENKKYFEDNYNTFKKQLEDLKAEYTPKFKDVSSHTIVTGHAAFGYLCRDFGLTQKSVEDTFAHGEPTPDKLAELADYSKANHVKVIFTEELVSPEVSQTLAKEAGAKNETIYTMESAEDNLSYIDRMKSNLQRIYEALK